MSEQIGADVESELLRLGGGDPFDDVLAASDRHRESHSGCLLYPAGPRVMSVAAQLVRATRPMRVLDLGSGLGYSTLWLAAAAPPKAIVTGIDGDEEHCNRAREFARAHGLAGKTRFMTGEVSSALEVIDGPFDFVHDDAWFASKPPHYERVLALLRRHGVLTQPNWFLLEDALTLQPRRDWAEFAGSGWQDSVAQFAAEVAQDSRLDPVWITRPPMLVAVRR
jgi:predicted O-methyltransferase YrrM